MRDGAPPLERPTKDRSLVRAEGAVSKAMRTCTGGCQLHMVQWKGCGRSGEARKAEGLTYHGKERPEEAGMEGVAGYRVFKELTPAFFW